MTLQLSIVRDIAATPETLFDAWTTPALLVQWWGPQGVKCIGAEIDLRAGGAYRIGNELPDGRVLWIEGLFELVERPHRIAYSWRVGSEPTSRVEVTFIATATGARVTIVHDRIHSVATKDDHERGWIGCIDGLERWLLSSKT